MCLVCATHSGVGEHNWPLLTLPIPDFFIIKKYQEALTPKLNPKKAPCRGLVVKKNVFLEAEPLYTYLCLSVRLPACPSQIVWATFMEHDRRIILCRGQKLHRGSQPIPNKIQTNDLRVIQKKVQGGDPRALPAQVYSANIFFIATSQIQTGYFFFFLCNALPTLWWYTQ